MQRACSQIPSSLWWLMFFGALRWWEINICLTRQSCMYECTQMHISPVTARVHLLKRCECVCLVNVCKNKSCRLAGRSVGWSGKAAVLRSTRSLACALFGSANSLRSLFPLPTTEPFFSSRRLCCWETKYSIDSRLLSHLIKQRYPLSFGLLPSCRFTDGPLQLLWRYLYSLWTSYPFHVYATHSLVN